MNSSKLARMEMVVSLAPAVQAPRCRSFASCKNPLAQGIHSICFFISSLSLSKMSGSAKEIWVMTSQGYLQGRYRELDSTK